MNATARRSLGNWGWSSRARWPFCLWPRKEACCPCPRHSRHFAKPPFAALRNSWTNCCESMLPEPSPKASPKTPHEAKRGESLMSTIGQGMASDISLEGINLRVRQRPIEARVRTALVSTPREQHLEGARHRTSPGAQTNDDVV